MTQECKMHEQPSIQPKPVAVDLSRAIDQTMERKPDEQVKSIRVFGDHYRCNWWVREKTGHGISFSTGAIGRSKFLRVTQLAGKLVIEDLSDRR